MKPLVPILLIGIAMSARAQLINGDFQTGDFTGWTFFTTAQGGIGQPQVTLFDTADTGTPSLSAQFEAGQVSGVVTGAKYGGGIKQNVNLGAGSLTISLDIATDSPGVNSDGGTFELLLDGSVVANHVFGSMAPSQPQYSILDYSGSVSAGMHDIAVEMLRGSYTQTGETPYQYVDNVTLGGLAVPEPSPSLLLALGLAVVVGGMQLRRRPALAAAISRRRPGSSGNAAAAPPAPRR
jgi:hypothetical protein